MTGGPGKEHGTNRPPSTERVQEMSKGDTTCPTASQNPFLWHPSWLNKVCTTRKDSEPEWLAKDNRETNPITIKLKTASPCGRAAPLGSLTLLLSTRVPLPNKISCFVSTCVSSDNLFLSVRQEPSFGPWKGSPFLQQCGLQLPDQGPNPGLLHWEHGVWAPGPRGKSPKRNFFVKTYHRRYFAQISDTES